MSTTVEFRLFSGIDNAQWQLSPAQEREFTDWVIQLFKVTNRPPFRAPIIDATLLPRLGYTGFDVTIDQNPPVRVYGDALVQRLSPPSGHLATIDEWLFATHRAALFEEFGIELEIVAARAAPRRIGNLPAGCDMPRLPCGPTMFPQQGSPWGLQPFLSRDACYNYANNVLTRRRVYPPSPHPRHRLWTVRDLQTALTADHLIFRAELPRDCPRDPAANYVIALLHTVGRAGDYHFLRLDRDGFWSHKNGSDPATNLDAHGVIADVCDAEFTAPYVFAGFFESNEAAQEELRRRG